MRERDGGSTTDGKNQSQGAGEHRAYLAASGEKEGAAQAFEEAFGCSCLFVPQTRHQPAVEPWTRLGRRPRIQRGKGCLQPGQVLAAGGAVLEMCLCRECLGRFGIQEKIGQGGLAVGAVHRVSFLPQDA